MMKLRIQKAGVFSEAFPSTKSYIEILSERVFPSMSSVQAELKENGPPFYKFSDIEKMAVNNNPLFFHAPYSEVKNRLQTLYDELIKKHNPDIAQKLYVDTKIKDMFIETLPFTIKELPICEVYDVNNFTRKVAKLVVEG